MTVVSAFRPFVPESPAHRKLGDFDWREALRMLRASVTRACGCPTMVLTDLTSEVPGLAARYATMEPRLMLWLLEVARDYLRSDQFTDDTVWISPDALVLRDLRPWFKADLGIMVRLGQKYVDKPLLNGVQFWRHEAQDRLVAFYTEALKLARGLTESLLRWGADTTPLVELLSPLAGGPFQRQQLSVYGFHAYHVFRAVSRPDSARLQLADVAILDFKGTRKWQMRQSAQALGLTW